MKKRLAVLESQANHKTKEIIINDVRIVDNVEDNRLQLFFPGIPSQEVRTYLKSHGFRWARSIGAWQRFRSNVADYHAKEVANLFGKENNQCQK